MQSVSVFLDIAKFVDFRWKMLMSSEIKGCITWFIYFLDLLWVRYNCAKFHHCRICVIDFREGGTFLPLHPWTISKRSILNRVNNFLNDISISSLSEIQKEIRKEELTEKDICKSMISFDISKSLGNDGLTKEFY